MFYQVISQSQFVRENFPTETEPTYIAEDCMAFDGAFLTQGYTDCLVCDGPWFPDYWKPLPYTPFDLNQGHEQDA